MYFSITEDVMKVSKSLFSITLIDLGSRTIMFIPRVFPVELKPIRISLSFTISLCEFPALNPADSSVIVKSEAAAFFRSAKA